MVKFEKRKIEITGGVRKISGVLGKHAFKRVEKKRKDAHACATKGDAFGNRGGPSDIPFSSPVLFARDGRHYFGNPAGSYLSSLPVYFRLLFRHFISIRISRECHVLCYKCEEDTGVEEICEVS